MAWRRGCTHTGVAQGNPRAPWGSHEAITDDREVDPRRESGWRYDEPALQPVSPPQLTVMLADSSACSQPGWGWALPISIPSVVMPLPERLRYLLSSGITRSIVSRTTTWRWWSGKVLSGHLRGPWQIWLGIWGPPLALATYCANCQSSLALSPCSMFLCKIFSRWATGIMKGSLLCHKAGGDPRGPTTPQGLPLPWGEKAYLWLHPVPLQHPQYIVFPAHDSCPKGGEQKWGDLGLGTGEGCGDHQTSGGIGWAEEPDCPVSGCPDPD